MTTNETTQHDDQMIVGEEELLHWDTMDYYETYDEWVTRKKNENYFTEEELQENLNYLSRKDYENEIAEDQQDGWNSMIYALTELIEERNPATYYWYCTTKNLGWMHRDGGYKYFKTTPDKQRKIQEGQVFLWALLPNTENTFHIYDYRSVDGSKRGLVISNANQDVPRGGEMYYCLPVTDEEYEENA